MKASRRIPIECFGCEFAGNEAGDAAPLDGCGEIDWWLAGVARIDVKGPRQIGGLAVQFLIDEVADAADCLPKQHGWRDEIEILDWVEPPDGAVEEDARDTTRYPAEDAQPAQPAIPKVPNLVGVVAVKGPASAARGRAKDVIESCADNAEDQHDAEQVPNVVLAFARAASILRGDPRAEHGSTYD